MQTKKRTIFAALLALGFARAAALPAAMEVAPPVTVKWNGFIQAWAGLGENALKEDKEAGVALKRIRFKMTAEAYDGVSVVILPELAQAFGLLDAFVAVDLSKYSLDWQLPLTLTMGQFKSPFGLNRMYLPGQLHVVDYAAIYNTPSGVFEASSFWDQGVMATWKGGFFKLDAAWVEGKGPNQTTNVGLGFGQKQGQDFALRLDLAKLWPGLVIGGSAYVGESFKAAGTSAFPLNTKDSPKLITGAHLKYATYGKGFGLEAELVNRGVDRGGYNVTLTQYVTDAFQLACTWDHVDVYNGAVADTTRWIGGLNWFPGGPVRLSLNQVGASSGISMSPVTSATILQTQVVF